MSGPLRQSLRESGPRLPPQREQDAAILHALADRAYGTHVSQDMMDEHDAGFTKPGLSTRWLQSPQGGVPAVPLSLEQEGFTPQHTHVPSTRRGLSASTASDEAHVPVVQYGTPATPTLSESGSATGRGDGASLPLASAWGGEDALSVADTSLMRQAEGRQVLRSGVSRAVAQAVVDAATPRHTCPSSEHDGDVEKPATAVDDQVSPTAAGVPLVAATPQRRPGGASAVEEWSAYETAVEEECAALRRGPVAWLEAPVYSMTQAAAFELERFCMGAAAAGVGAEEFLLTQAAAGVIGHACRTHPENEEDRMACHFYVRCLAWTESAPAGQQPRCFLGVAVLQETLQPVSLRSPGPALPQRLMTAYPGLIRQLCRSPRFTLSLVALRARSLRADVNAFVFGRQVANCLQALALHEHTFWLEAVNDVTGRLPAWEDGAAWLRRIVGVPQHRLQSSRQAWSQPQAALYHRGALFYHDRVDENKSELQGEEEAQHAEVSPLQARVVVMNRVPIHVHGRERLLWAMDANRMPLAVTAVHLEAHHNVVVLQAFEVYASQVAQNASLVSALLQVLTVTAREVSVTGRVDTDQAPLRLEVVPLQGALLDMYQRINYAVVAGCGMPDMPLSPFVSALEDLCERLAMHSNMLSRYLFALLFSEVRDMERQHKLRNKFETLVHAHRRGDKDESKLSEFTDTVRDTMTLEVARATHALLVAVFRTPQQWLKFASSFCPVQLLVGEGATFQPAFAMDHPDKAQVDGTMLATLLFKNCVHGVLGAVERGAIQLPPQCNGMVAQLLRQDDFVMGITVVDEALLARDTEQVVELDVEEARPWAAVPLVASAHEAVPSFVVDVDSMRCALEPLRVQRGLDLAQAMSDCAGRGALMAYDTAQEEQPLAMFRPSPPQYYYIQDGKRHPAHGRGGLPDSVLHALAEERKALDATEGGLEQDGEEQVQEVAVPAGEEEADVPAASSQARVDGRRYCLRARIMRPHKGNVASQRRAEEDFAAALTAAAATQELAATPLMERPGSGTDGAPSTADRALFNSVAASSTPATPRSGLGLGAWETAASGAGLDTGLSSAYEGVPSSSAMDALWQEGGAASWAPPASGRGSAGALGTFEMDRVRSLAPLSAFGQAPLSSARTNPELLGQPSWSPRLHAQSGATMEVAASSVPLARGHDDGVEHEDEAMDEAPYCTGKRGDNQEDVEEAGQGGATGKRVRRGSKSSSPAPPPRVPRTGQHSSKRRRVEASAGGTATATTPSASSVTLVGNHGGAALTPEHYNTQGASKALAAATQATSKRKRRAAGHRQLRFTEEQSAVVRKEVVDFVEGNRRFLRKSKMGCIPVHTAKTVLERGMHSSFTSLMGLVQPMHAPVSIGYGRPRNPWTDTGRAFRMLMRRPRVQPIGEDAFLVQEEQDAEDKAEEDSSVMPLHVFALRANHASIRDVRVFIHEIEVFLNAAGEEDAPPSVEGLGLNGEITRKPDGQKLVSLPVMSALDDPLDAVPKMARCLNLFEDQVTATLMLTEAVQQVVDVLVGDAVMPDTKARMHKALLRYVMMNLSVTIFRAMRHMLIAAMSEVPYNSDACLRSSHNPAHYAATSETVEFTKLLGKDKDGMSTNCAMDAAVRELRMWLGLPPQPSMDMACAVTEPDLEDVEGQDVVMAGAPAAMQDSSVLGQEV